MKETKISDIERINIVVLVIGSILAIVVMREFKYVFSFAVASAIMTLNFRFIKKIIEGGLLKPEGKKVELAIKLPIKFLILIALVAIVVIYGDIDVVFFPHWVINGIYFRSDKSVFQSLEPCFEKEAKKWGMIGHGPSSFQF